MEGFDANFAKVRLFEPKVLLLDFHGTICSTRWEQRQLLPFVLQQLADYLQQNWNVLQVEQLVQQLRADSYVQRFAGFRDDAPLVDQRDTVDGPEAGQENQAATMATNLPTPEELNTLVAFIRWQVQQRRETTECLQLQRLIWQQGLADGRLKVHLFADVPSALTRWKKAGIRLCMFSSVQQADLRLMLQHTQYGNVLDSFESLFDPTIGNRLQPTTYRKLADLVQVVPQRMLYLTDVGKVAKMAAQTGIDCTLVVRPENARVREYYLTSFSFVNSFDLIEFVPVSREMVSMVVNRLNIFREETGRESKRSS